MYTINRMIGATLEYKGLLEDIMLPYGNTLNESSEFTNSSLF